jgi:cytochrome b subunit of formate dehydrogenase
MLRSGIGTHWGIDPYYWCPYFAAAVGLCAVADWLEDAVHLSYLRPKGDPPAIQPPSRGLVLFATSMTSLKYVLFLTGLVATVLASLRTIYWQVVEGPVGGLAGVAIALIVLFIVGVFMQFAAGQKDPSAG